MPTVYRTINICRKTGTVTKLDPVEISAEDHLKMALPLISLMANRVVEEYISTNDA